MNQTKLVRTILNRARNGARWHGLKDYRGAIPEFGVDHHDLDTRELHLRWLVINEVVTAARAGDEKRLVELREELGAKVFDAIMVGYREGFPAPPRRA
jgi:hypothetical protein